MVDSICMDLRHSTIVLDKLPGTTHVNSVEVIKRMTEYIEPETESTKKLTGTVRARQDYYHDRPAF
jgi:hypothetical protein